PGGAVLDGRDIGTIIATQAEAKLFIIASVEARAQRRFAEMQARGENHTLESIAEDLRPRDERDQNRSDAPLRAADDATILDTSDLNKEQAITAAIAIVNSALPKD